MKGEIARLIVSYFKNELTASGLVDAIDAAYTEKNVRYLIFSVCVAYLFGLTIGLLL